MEDFITRGYFPILTSIFDDTAKVLNESMRTVKTNYPMNIVDLDGKGFELEIALAGFPKESIQVEVKDSILYVKVSAPITEERSYLRKGISYRDMESSFKLSERIDVSNITVKFVDGLLIINVPIKKDSETNTRKIEII